MGDAVPRRVDHEERRTRIATALWRVATARGLDRVSLREVATEAGVSLGQLQHYFPSRDDLLVFAMEFMRRKNVERVTQRVAALGSPAASARLRAIAREMLTLDDRSVAGSLMNFTFLLEGIHNETLRGYARSQGLALRGVLEHHIGLAVAEGDIPVDRDPRREATALMGLADGLRAGFHLGLHTADEAWAVMDGQLARLFG
ncbi:MAG: TetR/AcrR family transcriptional regulator [Actinocatenispora sp.]